MTTNAGPGGTSIASPRERDDHAGEDEADPVELAALEVAPRAARRAVAAALRRERWLGYSVAGDEVADLDERARPLRGVEP